ncbi:MAG: nuclear transport factor 2 family protein [Geminicoccaceae bacterium]
MSIEAYARYWETLSPATTGDLRGLARSDLVFRDPFNEIRGVDAVVAMLDRMFRDLGQPRFVVVRIASDGPVSFIRWDFTFELRGRPLRIEGVSEVELDGEGRVARHIDHWDAAGQVYERIPLLGGLLRQVRKRLAAHD